MAALVSESAGAATRPTMKERSMANAYRVCDLCGGVDDHPRHSFAGVIGDVHPVNEALRQQVSDNCSDLYGQGKITFDDAARIMASFLDTTSSDRHIDCCAAQGCPLAGTPHDCALRAAEAKGKTGKAMVAAANRVRAAQEEEG